MPGAFCGFDGCWSPEVKPTNLTPCPKLDVNRTHFNRKCIIDVTTLLHEKLET